MDWKRIFLSPRGRLGRGDFWIAWAMLFAAGIALGWFPLVGGLITLGLIWPSLCIHTKRLHDAGRSGWIQLIPYAAQAALFGSAAFVFGEELRRLLVARVDTHGEALAAPHLAVAHLGALLAFTLVSLVSVAIWLAFAYWVGSREPDRQENRYGPVPPKLFLQPSSAEQGRPG